MLNITTISKQNNSLSVVDKNELYNNKTDILATSNDSRVKIPLNDLTSYITERVDLSNVVTYDHLNSCSYVNYMFFDSQAIVGAENRDSNITNWTINDGNLVYCNLRTRTNKNIRLYGPPPVGFSSKGIEWLGPGLMTYNDKAKLDTYPNDYNDINALLDDKLGNKLDIKEGYSLVPDSTLTNINHLIAYNNSYVIYNFNDLLNLNESSTSSDIINAFRLRYSYMNIANAEIKNASTIDNILYHCAKYGKHIIDGFKFTQITVEHVSNHYLLTSSYIDSNNEYNIASVGLQYSYDVNLNGTLALTQPKQWTVVDNPKLYNLSYLITAYNVSYNNALRINEIDYINNGHNQRWTTEKFDLCDNKSDSDETLKQIKINNSIFGNLKYISSMTVKLQIDHTILNNKIQIQLSNGKTTETSINSVHQRDNNGKYVTFYFNEPIPVSSASIIDITVYSGIIQTSLCCNIKELYENAVTGFRIYDSHNTRHDNWIPAIGFNVTDIVQTDLYKLISTSINDNTI